MAKVLREPPEVFRLAMSGLHQDIDIICHKEGVTRAQHVADVVSKSDYAQLATYLDALLLDESVTSADLKGLINRHDTCVSFRRASEAREFLTSLRDELRQQAAQ